MKVTVLALSLLFALRSVALGQGISVELVLEQDQFLPHETLTAKIKITNFTGQDLILGQEDDWLVFDFEGRNHFIVTKLGPVPVKAEFTLESSSIATKKVDLAPYFDLSRPGNYTVVATVRFFQVRQVLQTKPVSFNIIRGTEVWEQDFGVPGVAGQTNSPPEFRKYALIQATYRKQLTLYLRLSDPQETEVYKIYPIGPVLSFSKLEPQLDKFNNLHLLYQSGARGFLYHMINPDGLILSRETYVQGEARPYLKLQEEGRIAVAGGVRRVTPNDLPPPISTTFPNDAALPPH